ncbi:MAG: hypothetical protein M3P10_07945 [Actinomycetota bacterium]|nr:hypothetical protein [Actinomycetota bacterium]
MELADAPRDELSVLAAKVEDDYGVRLGGGLRVALGRRGMQGGLEIDLNLRIVRDQDPVTRVGQLTVDSAPALLGRRAPLVSVSLLVGALVQSRRRAVLCVAQV